MSRLAFLGVSEGGGARLQGLYLRGTSGVALICTHAQSGQPGQLFLCPRGWGFIRGVSSEGGSISFCTHFIFLPGGVLNVWGAGLLHRGPGSGLPVGAELRETGGIRVRHRRGGIPPGGGIPPNVVPPLSATHPLPGPPPVLPFCPSPLLPRLKPKLQPPHFGGSKPYHRQHRMGGAPHNMCIDT